MCRWATIVLRQTTLDLGSGDLGLWTLGNPPFLGRYANRSFTLAARYRLLTRELVHQQNDAMHEHAKGSIFEYIEVFYNRVRLHSTLGYVSSKAFEASLT